jgi:hypothetical protein
MKNAVAAVGVILLFALPNAQSCQYALYGDINSDCKIDFFDFAQLAKQWFNSCDGPNWCNFADIDRNGDVGLGDLLAIGHHWLIDCNLTPGDIACEPITVFNYAIASRGPLLMSGRASVEGFHDHNEANIYIEASNTTGDALSMLGYASIAGDVDIASPYAEVSIYSNASIGGIIGADAISHIHMGIPYSAFPTPDPSVFESYATNIVDHNTNIGNTATFKNIRIHAGTNPRFINKEFKGVIFIEQPNRVTFTGNTEIEGVIVTNESFEDSSGSNAITFAGSVNMTVPTDRIQYGNLVDLIGTAILAPGFTVDFGYPFTMHGTIAANGININGNAGGTVRGSIINYSNDSMAISGLTHVIFDHSNLPKRPAGFR